MEKLKILIIGCPSPRLREMERQLQRSGYRVNSARDTRNGVQRAESFLPDLVILDQRLPDAESLEVCRRIRNEVPPKREPAYLLLSHLPFEADSSSDLADVASDHLNKVQALLGCAPSGVAVYHHQLRLSIDGLKMDLRRHEASLDGRPLDLTPIEFRLLWAIASDPGVVYDRQQLRQRCHGSGNLRRERTIDVHINGLRTKLGERASLIQTVRGVGYRMRVRRNTDPV